MNPEPTKQTEPADVYYDPTKPACLKHGWGHWTKDCPELSDTKQTIRALLKEARTDEYGDSGNYSQDKLIRLIESYAQQRERELLESLELCGKHTIHNVIDGRLKTLKEGE